MSGYIGDELEEGQTDILCLCNDFIGAFNDLLLVFTQLHSMCVYINLHVCAVRD